MAKPRLRFPGGGASGRDLLGFDIGEETVKIVHVKVSKLGREVVNLASIEARGLPEPEIAKAVQKTIAAFGVKNPRGFLTVPMQTVISRTIEVPSQDPAEIREIVNLQASRHTPYARSEIIVDTLILGLARENYTRVLLVIAPREAVVRATGILERAGVKLDKVFFPPEGICHACTRILGKEAEGAVAVVHMDAAFTSFIVIKSNHVLFVRGIAIGGRQLLDERAAHADPFVDELQKSFEGYTTDEAGPPPSVLLLTGVAAETRDLDTLFSETLKIPIKHQTYFNHFSVSKQAIEAASASKNISFFNVIAPLLVYERMQVDLNTDERKQHLQFERRAREAVTTGMLVITLLLFGFALLGSKVYFKKTYLENLVARYATAIEDAKQLENMFTKTRVVKDYLANRGNSIETLADLVSAMPGDVRLSAVRYEEGTKFTVKGSSNTMASVFTFVTSLEKSQKFGGVKTKYVTSRSEGGLDMADFEIVADIQTAEVE